MTNTNQVAAILAALPLTRSEKLIWWGIYERLRQLEGSKFSHEEVVQRFTQTLEGALVRVGRAQEN